ncbi:methyl-accepting chemotaxis protein [Agrobacterium rosae]|uniref:Methyl-accepting chemotaxis protein n=2 Tax=Agrobacterium rosae TaxID=1972867 RepID=A0AAE5VRS4_9HYPH|nr:HAMP domain-containing methyl-accepting chemotaxis protein [Agrobacterium rosae]KAA3510969.1 methyl-accepting chemotaxis protein [Agrobacterium rosae]KAA3518007.1 methyl-accepting chemotaxis protein [Agrobacterium rosae]MCM2434292.1 HAMP domain-containing protein [Agrobacterium rosae]MDX8329440.1 HAMP domain-containing methyl-accepting chemotaxis protein [Agrobacterium rosae]MQB49573.1 methyl-accepting chemotaxis protein [Agrobacterium rosae]
MMIDNLLARFKIQTKVIVFIAPFVASILAVGFSGLYASNLLQSRMDVSNTILQSLTGFKEVYGGMTSFLNNTNDETRATLHRQLAEQANFLRATEDGDSTEIKDAIDRTKIITNQVDELWSSHQKEQALRAGMDADLSVIKKELNGLLANATNIRNTLQTDETKAKLLLREADKLNRGANLIATVVTDFNRVTSPEEKTAVVKAAIGSLETTAKELVAIASVDQKMIIEQLAEGVTQIRAQLDIGIVNDATVGAIDRVVNLMRPSTIRLQGFATVKSRQATEVFGKLDQPIEQATAFLATARQIAEDAKNLELEMAGFVAAPAKPSLEKFRDVAFRLNVSAGEMMGDSTMSEATRKSAGSIDAMATKLDRASADLFAMSQQRQVAFRMAEDEIRNVWASLTSFAEKQRTAADTERSKADGISLSAMVIGVFVAIFAGIGLVMTFKGPILGIVGSMKRLAKGDIDIPLTGKNRHDEIGDMARALEVFKENAEERIRLEASTQEQRASAEAQRQSNDAERKELDRQIQFAVTALAGGLERLSAGDISTTIDTPFSDRLEQLRVDFNQSMLRLRETIGGILENVGAIRGNAQQMSESAVDLARRTERQAASLEETAAAVDEVNSNMRNAVDRAREANTIVDKTRRNTDDSLVIVGNAISAMERIENASKTIGNITEVIDSISFQTNLLALNAGVEAARAGEAGKGFAVVAHEVRELAQRSAAAAKEIRQLIAVSNKEVAAGSSLVSQTGEALAQIGTQISHVSEHVQQITQASQDQSVAMQQINSSVGEVDVLTQQNAAMVEETSAASEQLNEETDQLLGLLEQFRLDSTQDSRRDHRRAA